MYSRKVLFVICCHYGMSLDANGCVFTLVNVNWIKWMYFCVNEFKVGVDDHIFFGNGQQKVYRRLTLLYFWYKVGKLSSCLSYGRLLSVCDEDILKTESHAERLN